MAKNNQYDKRSSRVISDILQKIGNGFNFEYLGSRYTGELQGMLNAYLESMLVFYLILAGQNSNDALKMMSNRIRNEFKDLTAAKSRLDYEKLSSLLYRAAAIITYGPIVSFKNISFFPRTIPI
jgi:hypothetical protein